MLRIASFACLDMIEIHMWLHYEQSTIGKVKIKRLYIEAVGRGSHYLFQSISLKAVPYEKNLQKTLGIDSV